MFYALVTSFHPETAAQNDIDRWDSPGYKRASRSPVTKSYRRTSPLCSRRRSARDSPRNAPKHVASERTDGDSGTSHVGDAITDVCPRINAHGKSRARSKRVELPARWPKSRDRARYAREKSRRRCTVSVDSEFEIPDSRARTSAASRRVAQLDAVQCGAVAASTSIIHRD